MRLSASTDPLSNFHIHHSCHKLDRNLVGEVGGTGDLWVMCVQPAAYLEQEIVRMPFLLCSTVFSPALTPCEPAIGNLAIDLACDCPLCSFWIRKRSVNQAKSSERTRNLKEVASYTGDGTGLIHGFEELARQSFKMRGMVLQKKIAEAGDEVMMIFFPIAPGVEEGSQLLDADINRLDAKDFPCNRGNGKGFEQGIEIGGGAEQIGHDRKLTACWMLSYSIVSSVSLSKGTVVWANDLNPFLFSPGPECLATAVHFNEHDAHRIMANVGTGMGHREHILQWREQTMKAFFR